MEPLALDHRLVAVVPGLSVARMAGLLTRGKSTGAFEQASALQSRGVTIAFTCIRPLVDIKRRPTLRCRKDP